jgi:hypothetical protein
MKYRRYALASTLAVGLVASLAGVAAADQGTKANSAGKPRPSITSEECPILPALPALPKTPGKAPTTVELKDGVIVADGEQVGTVEGTASGDRHIVVMKDGKTYTGEEAEKIAKELPPRLVAAKGDSPAGGQDLVVTKDGKTYTGEEAKKIAKELPPPVVAKKGGTGDGPGLVCVIVETGEGASKASK